MLSQCKATFRAGRAGSGRVRTQRLHVAAALKVGDKLPAFEVKTDQNTTITSKARVQYDCLLHLQGYSLHARGSMGYGTMASAHHAPGSPCTWQPRNILGAALLRSRATESACSSQQTSQSTSTLFSLRCCTATPPPLAGHCRGWCRHLRLPAGLHVRLHAPGQRCAAAAAAAPLQ